jgi:hypothetical protein
VAIGATLLLFINAHPFKGFDNKLFSQQKRLKHRAEPYSITLFHDARYAFVQFDILNAPPGF